MERIRSMVLAARRRLVVQAWLGAACSALAFTAGLLVVMVLERRLLGLGSALGVPSAGAAWWAVAALSVAVAAGAWAWWRVRRALPALDEVALELDRRLGSAERFATALALSADAGSAGDPFARAAIADATAHANDPDVARRAARAFPLALPRRWWVGPGMLGLAFALLASVPQLERASKDEHAVLEAQADRPQTPEERALEDVVRQIESAPELAAKLDAELDAAKRSLDEAGRGPVRPPEDAAREAMRRMTELQQRLEEISESRESKASRELQDALAKLDLPKDDNAAKQLAEALKQGNFEAAKEAVQKLQEQAAKDGGLSAEEREKLAKALSDTAKQLEALSKDPSKLAEALKQAGMDPSLANNPLAMQQAIEASKDLNASQKQALRQMAQSMSDAQQKLAQMSQQMNQMSQQCKNPGAGQQGQKGQQGQQDGSQSQDGQQPSQQQGESGSESMSQMLDEAETERQMAMASESCKNQCQGGGAMSESEADSALRASAEGDGEGSAANGSSNGRKSGSGGGRGQAEGGTRQVRETAFGTKVQKQKSPRGEGDVIARQLVAGQSPVGESRVALEEVAGTIATGYEKGTEDDPVPAHLREVHKKYFGDVRRTFDQKGIKPATPAGAAPAPADKGK
jgi:hypothetical protein